MTDTRPFRRVEAVVASGAAVTAGNDLLRAVGLIGASHITLAVVSEGATAELAQRLSPAVTDGATVLVASTNDDWAAVIDGHETWIVPRDVIREPDQDDDGATVGAAARWVRSELWRRGVGPADTVTITVPHVLAALVGEQAERRTAHQLPAVEPDDLWAMRTHAFDVERARVNGSLFALADGMIGTSGSAMAAYEGARRWVIAGGVYVGDGADSHLLTAPVAMQLPYDMAAEPDLRRVLDLHAGVLHEELSSASGTVSTVRFASLARPGLVVSRSLCPDRPPDTAPLGPPVDDQPVDGGCDGEVTWMRVAGSDGGVAAAAAEEWTGAGDPSGDGTTGSVVDRFAAYVASSSEVPDPGPAVTRAGEARRAGFDTLLAEHRAAWASRWDEADIEIEGDDDLQQQVRFALFHLMAAVPDTGEAAVGARGLAGTGYRGHVFWDADTFTLPFLAATHPSAARAMLEYRIRRLPAARRFAARLGRAGARFPWESAADGTDVTPLAARDRTGQRVPIRTGQLEEHIVAEVAWAACCYSDWTGDEDFARGPGFELLVETARYWASRIRVERQSGHIFGVIGPDEYHEPVDDNAFTNVMARWNLRRAADAVAALAPHGPLASEAEQWDALADAVVDGYDPDTGIYEQFSGFRQLERLIIAETAPRRPIAADLLLGRDRVRQAQIIKQADVLMLHHLVPEEVEPGTLEPNLRYYEPRTAHGSSLSPGIHAALFARAREYERALETLDIACRMDLDDLSGTTASGLHLATMGSVWQALAFGFFGVRPTAGRLLVDPRLPPAWGGMAMRLRFHGTKTVIRIGHDELRVESEGRVPVVVDGIAYDVEGRPLTLVRPRHRWEVSR